MSIFKDVLSPNKVRTEHAGEDSTIMFADYLNMAIRDSYLIVCLVSSHTQGRIKSLNLPYGLGKTTFAMWASYITNAVPGTYPPPKLLHKDPSKFRRIMEMYNPYDLTISEVSMNWDKVFSQLVYNIVDCARLIRPGTGIRRKMGVWDDVAATAPAERGVPSIIYKLKGYITTARPEIACLMLTASNRNEIVAPIRRLVVIEIIIAERGVYEVQRVKYYKNFRNPNVDISRLDYMEESIFPPLPKAVQIRYDAWRVKEKLKIFPQIEAGLERWLKMSEPVDYSKVKEIEARVIKEGPHYRITIPHELGKKYHRKALKVLVPKIAKRKKRSEEETPYETES